MRQRVISALQPLDAVSVENSAYPGTPDVNYIGGWIECKWLRSWPKRETSSVRVDHFTPQQKVWLRRREKRGGDAWLLLQCRTTWLLFRGTQAAEILGSATRDELHAAAVRIWDTGLVDSELLEALAGEP